MKFFTPSLMRHMQSDRFTPHDWCAVTDAYRSHVGVLSPDLSRSVRRFSQLCFHDCRIRRIEFFEQRSVAIWLDGFKGELGGTSSVAGTHHVTFKKVSETNLAVKHLSLYWSYEEIDRSPEGTELRVLLSEGGRFYIRFSDVVVRTLASRNAVRNPPR